MAISIDYTTRIINVPKADLALVEGTNYTLDVDAFRLELKNIEDSTDGIVFVDSHKHTPPVTLSGSTYARFVEIINGYTIEFEDGQYGVGLQGANNNIVDVLVRNQVSVVANNSSGLIESDLIEFSSYQNQVTIDAVSGSAGTKFPIGTPTDPVSNVADAVTIAQNRGLSVLYFSSNYTFDGTENVDGFDIVGAGPTKTNITFHASTSTAGVEVFDATLSGNIEEATGFYGAHIDGLTVTGTGAGETVFHDCIFDAGGFTQSSTITGDLEFYNCKSGVPGTSTPYIDLNSSTSDVLVRDWTGGVEWRNINQGQNISMDFVSGQTILASSVTSADITIRGIAKVTDNSVGATINDETTNTSISGIAAGDGLSFGEYLSQT